jgi:hypothetical protein
MMTILKNTIAVSLLVLSLAACDNTKQKKLEFNNKIAEETVKAQNKALELQKTMSLNPNSTPADIQKAKESINTIAKAIEGNLNTIKKLDVPQGGEKLHNAAISDLETALEFLQKDTIELLDFAATNPPQDKKMAKVTALMEKAQGMTKKDAELRDAQQAFAKEAGFLLENKPQ